MLWIQHVSNTVIIVYCNFLAVAKDMLMSVHMSASLHIHTFWGKFRLILGNTPSPVRMMSCTGRKATFS